MDDLTQKEAAARAALKLVDGLLERALDVVGANPSMSSVSRDERPVLSIDGNEAWLRWREPDYDGYIMDEECSFPLYLLFISEEQLAAWKLGRETAYQIEQQRKCEESVKRHEEKERLLLLQLQAKYGRSLT